MGNAHAFPTVFLHINKQNIKDILMEEKETLLLTDFDVSTLSDELQMLKSFLPFVDMPQQRSLALFIRIYELLCTLDFYNNAPSPSPLYRRSHDKKDIFQEIKNYCPKKDREIFDMMSNMDNISEFYNMFQTMNQEPGEKKQTDMLKNFLSPKQQELYEYYSKSLNI